MSLPRRMSGIGLFCLGLLISVSLILVSFWPDMEADFYGFSRTTTARLKGLRCPILIARDEHPLVTARVTNKTTYTRNITLRADFSGIAAERSESQLVPFAPAETRTVSWAIGAEDAIYGGLILAKVYMRGAYPMPPSEGTCGAYVLGLSGVNGVAVYWTLFALGLAALLAGVWLLEPPRSALAPGERRPDGAGPSARYGERPAQAGEGGQRASPRAKSLAGARRGVAVAAVIGLAVSYLGLWILAIISLVVIALILFGMLVMSASS